MNEKGNLIAGCLNISLGILLFVLNTLHYLFHYNSKKIVLLNFFIFLLCSILIYFYVNTQLEKNGGVMPESPKESLLNLRQRALQQDKLIAEKD